MKQHEFKDVKFIIGENAEDNWNLFDMSKEINEDYVWFHLNSFASPYVIMYSTIFDIKASGNIETYINYGAALCLEKSKYSSLKDTKIIYSPLKKLNKGSKVGEIIVSGKRKLVKVMFPDTFENTN